MQTAQIKQEEITELLKLQNTARRAFLARSTARGYCSRKTAKKLVNFTFDELRSYANSIEEKIKISIYFLVSLAGIINERNLPHEVFYKILELLGVEITEQPAK